CWKSTGSPPIFGSKIGNPSERSAITSTRVIAMTGVPRIITRLVAYCAHTKSGRRNHVMPGARIRCTVTMKLKPVRIDEKPVTKTPSAAVVTAGVDAAAEDRRERDRRAEHVDVPAEQVDAREGEVLRADHDRNQEVSERGR